MSKHEPCDYAGCLNEADFIDAIGNFVCTVCMEREVKDSSSEYEDFETIGDL
tara:strand:+ start:415 stop:570 length:156 start_codon:yes stop_codon:yes gene_type:complete